MGPYLDMTCHDTRPKNPVICEFKKTNFPKIEQIILFGEPNRWETNLQILIDCIVSDGDLHIPIIGANMDLQWQAEAPGPRFGHGMFMTTLEAAYSKLTNGKSLKYTALAGKPSPMTYDYAENVLLEMNPNLGNV